MQKTVTLRCPTCGKQYTFNVGAGASLSGWREIVSLVSDKKEADKLNEIYVKLNEKRPKAFMSEFGRNAADALNNIIYEEVGESSTKILDEEKNENIDSLIGEKASDSIAASKEKWHAAVGREGVLAFEAIYMCPKSRKPKQGMHVSVRYKDDKGRPVLHVYRNKCDDCSNTLMLVDDMNAGFMHESAVTVLRCEDCAGAQLVVDSVSFKQPVKEEGV